MSAKPQDPRGSDEVDRDPASTTHESLGVSEGGAATVSHHQPEAEFLQIAKENSMTEKIVNPEQEKCLVYGEAQGFLVFIPSQQARELAAIFRAAEVSRTWGEFRTWIDPHRWEEILWQLGKERLPLDEDEFDDGVLWHVMDASFWPEWPLSTMLEWMPKSIASQYKVEMAMDGDCLILPLGDEQKIVAELKRLGYLCVRNQPLVDCAVGERS